MTFVPGEAITSVMRALLEPGDHVITVLPNYQSAENVPRSLCEVTGVPLRPEDGWDLDTDAIAAALRPSTRLIAVNFPNNPTGSVASPGQWRALVDLARDRGIYLFSDEIYRGVERDPARTLPQAADLYERAISLAACPRPTACPGCGSAGSPAATRRCWTGPSGSSTTGRSAVPRPARCWPGSRSRPGKRCWPAPAR
jgi:bifunctional pyridoxal-dependent enzyme with beta-cystathionase and maltose regulon repressor activities